MTSSRRQFIGGVLGGLIGGAAAILGWAKLNGGNNPDAAATLGAAPTSLLPVTTTTVSSSSTSSPVAPTSTVDSSTTSSTAPPSTTTSTSTTPPPTTSTTTTTAPPATTTVPPTTTAGALAAFSTVAGEMPALCKAAWGANPNLGEFKPHTIERFTVHHTAAFLKSPGQAPARARQHQKYHLGKGWPDLAYHFLVDALGNVYEGRPIDAVGDTGTSYDPTGHFLIAAEGSFSEQGLPAAQLAAMAELLAWAAVTYDVDPSEMRGHKDWAPETSCPGNAVYAHIANGTLESMMRDAVARGVKQVRVVCSDAAKQYVKDLEATA
ncbi:MAG: N-acetylmuramoyl-L-alanine amidase [Actinobacteria bacterium]|nr:N-acetylmuramoyl-L-alanine amidase [Actinomycetota bacterium]